MKRMTRLLWLMTLVTGMSLVGLIALRGGVIAALQPPPSPVASPTPCQAPQPLMERCDGWSYIAVQQDGTLEVGVTFDASTRQGIESFANANRQLIGQVHGSVSATVVFQRPLSIQEFQDLVGKSGIQVISYTLRAIDNQGLRVTIAGRPEGNELIPQGTLNSILGHTPGGPPSFKGVITVDATATQGQLKQLLTDARIYMIDVTQAIAAERARTKAMANDASAAQLPVHTHQIAPIYWFMENAGIAAK